MSSRVRAKRRSETESLNHVKSKRRFKNLNFQVMIAFHAHKQRTRCEPINGVKVCFGRTFRWWLGQLVLLVESHLQELGFAIKSFVGNYAGADLSEARGRERGGGQVKNGARDEAGAGWARRASWPGIALRSGRTRITLWAWRSGRASSSWIAGRALWPGRTFRTGRTLRTRRTLESAGICRSQLPVAIYFHQHRAAKCYPIYTGDKGSRLRSYRADADGVGLGGNTEVSNVDVVRTGSKTSASRTAHGDIVGAGGVTGKRLETDGCVVAAGI